MLDAGGVRLDQCEGDEAGVGQDDAKCDGHHLARPHRHERRRTAPHLTDACMSNECRLPSRCCFAAESGLHCMSSSPATRSLSVMLAAGCEGVSAINTITSVMGINLDTLRPEPCVEGHSTPGGYSSKAVKPIALAKVRKES